MKLKGRHHEAITLHLAGDTQGAIATKLKRGERTVHRWFADDDFMAELIAESRRHYIHLAAEARRVVLALMRSADRDSVRLRAAQDIQDRAGLKPTEKVVTEELDLYGYSAEEIIAQAEGILAGLGRRRIPEAPGGDRPGDVENG